MEDDDEQKMRVQMDLIRGRDDLAIAALEGVKPRHRAEKLRQFVILYLSGRSIGSEGREEGVVRHAAASSEPVPKEPVRETGKSGPIESGGMDMSQLDGVDMQMDFLSMGGGKR